MKCPEIIKEAIGIGAFKGGPEALKTQGWFRNPNNPNDYYLSDSMIAKMKKGGPEATVRNLDSIMRTPVAKIPLPKAF